MRWVTTTVMVTAMAAWLAASENHNDQALQDREPDTAPAESVLPSADEPAMEEPRNSPGPSGPPWRRGRAGMQAPGDAPGPHGRFGSGRMHLKRREKPADEQTTPEQIDELMKFLEDNLPELHERLSRLRKTHPSGFERMLHRRFILEIRHLLQKDPKVAKQFVQMHKVEMKLNDLRRQFHGATSDEEREQIKARMREQLQARCDLHVEHLRTEIRQLRELLDRAIDELARREQERDKIVEEELAQMLQGKQPSPGVHRGPWMRSHGRPPPPPDEP